MSPFALPAEGDNHSDVQAPSARHDYREVIDGLVTGHRGRVFGSAGDNAVAEFTTVTVFPSGKRTSRYTGFARSQHRPHAPQGQSGIPACVFPVFQGRGVETGLCGAYRSAIDGGHDARLWHVDRECLPAFFAGDLFALRILEGDRLPVFTVRAVGDPLIRGLPPPRTAP